ncbi:MAG TPA: hypothetical protein VM241_03280, partial [Candidatus Thermoplasmatota archaeon]|nr:hypothetical protein [Candidatus Thermoplasmatota archaeon]
MHKAWLAVLLLSLGALAGCAASKNGVPTTGPADAGSGSPATLAIRAPELLMLPSSTDGKKLETVVYRPDTATPVPVFINFSP